MVGLGKEKKHIHAINLLCLIISSLNLFFSVLTIIGLTRLSILNVQIFVNISLNIGLTEIKYKNLRAKSSMLSFSN